MTTPGGTESATAVTQTKTYKPRYIDIGINLADPVFRGRYNGKTRHPDDLADVIDRAKQVGCTKLIITGSSFNSVHKALKLTQAGTVYATAGIHPCSSAIFGASSTFSPAQTTAPPQDANNIPSEEEEEEEEDIPPRSSSSSKDQPQQPDPQRTHQLISSLKSLIESAHHNYPNTLVAFGEFGLDYDRLHFCPKELQLHSFAAQLALSSTLSPQLPLFLHSRAAHADFVSCLKTAYGPKLEKLHRAGGVVHSFTGTAEEMEELMDLGLYIGINGCSFKTAENCEVVKRVRLDRLMLETDGPWCDVRPSHEGWKYLVKYHEGEEQAKEIISPMGPLDSGATSGEGQGDSNALLAETDKSPPAPTTSKKKNNNKQQQQPQKEPSIVPERFRSVKKEKWVEGAMVKSRNEPCMIERVAQIVAAIKGVSVEEVCEAAWDNTTRVFQLK